MSDTNTQPELLQCPFCGGDPILDTPADNDHGRWSVYCDNCLASTFKSPFRDTPIRDWNSRVDKNDEKGS